MVLTKIRRSDSVAPLRNGTASNVPPDAPSRSNLGNAAIASTTVMPLPTTRPKTVNPPFWQSNPFGQLPALLSLRLKNHSLVALFGPPFGGPPSAGAANFAIAIVPRKLETPNSLFTWLNSAMCGAEPDGAS